MEAPYIRSISVLLKFSEVFQNYMLGMPSDIEIDSYIDLEPGTRLISITPSHMASAELRVLEDQIQELHYKGFIHSFASPWVAPILFVKRSW